MDQVQDFIEQLSEKKHQISIMLDMSITLLWGILLLIFPLIFTTFTSEGFTLPKQILFILIVLIILVLWGIIMAIDGKTKLRRSPLDLPVFSFLVACTLSVIFSINRLDAAVALVPLFSGAIAYFLLLNIARKEQTLLFFLSAFIFGGVVLSLLSIFGIFNIFPIPIVATHTVAFSPLGSLLSQAIYIVLVLPVALYFVLPLLKNKFDTQIAIFSVASLLLLIGLGRTVFLLITSQKPLLLPYLYGFQTAFAAISQDTGRIAQGFFFGSGFGTYLNDFTRFKQATFNQYQNLWFLNFSQSSTWMLELLATTGVLGIAGVIFIFVTLLKRYSLYRANPLFFSLSFFIIIAFLLPITPIILLMFFVLLGLFAAIEAVQNRSGFFDVELHFVALKKGVIAMQSLGHGTQRAMKSTRIMPYALLGLFVIIAALVGFGAISYVLSDAYFQKSIVAANQNNGTQTYQNQKQAIQIYPYKDLYYVAFSQTNLALANSLAVSLAKNKTPDTQTQNTVYTLIQQSITAARTATMLAPLTSANWSNLGEIYRSLIGFGQNAESFSLAALQQAANLDPANPQEYISLGGLYYQLGQYDNAIHVFQLAVNTKPDFANAYYNLGHAYQQKGDLQNAMANYQLVKQLLASDPTNEKKIDDEIAQLQKQVQNGTVTTGQSTQNTSKATQSQQLQVNQSQTQLPPQTTPVKIPPLTPTPTINATPTLGQ